MTSSDAEPFRLRLWQIMAFIALVALLLAPLGSVLRGLFLGLYLSLLALIVPWGLLVWVRSRFEWSLMRSIVSMGLFGLPMVLTIGLMQLAGPLGIDDGNSLPNSLLMAPAALVATFAALFVGPWLCVFAIRDAWKRGQKRDSLSSTAKLMVCVAAMALVFAALRYAVLVFPFLAFATMGYFVAFVVSEHTRQAPIRLNLDRRPDETGYVPRADGDDPFA